jgi:hypothetical protein
MLLFKVRSTDFGDTTMRQLRLIIAALFLISPFAANADLIGVEWTDNDGPQWTGVVDTTTNSLAILTWVEGAGGVNWWTPSTPLTFQAYLAPTFPTTFAALTAFDVADAWDGTIGANWGFLSDLTKDAITWNEGVFTGNTSRLGWGISQFNSGTIRVNFSTEMDFAFTPFSISGNLVAHADSVTVTKVPEPGTLTLLGIGLLGLGLARRKTA